MRHYFSADEFKLMDAMLDEGNHIYLENYGPFGKGTTRVRNTDEECAHIDPELFDWFGDPDKFDDCYYTIGEIEEMGGEFPGFGDNIVVCDDDIGQSHCNYGLWESCIGEIYCDEDDYNEFMEDHEEFQTKEWHIQQIKDYMKEHEISLEDLK